MSVSIREAIEAILDEGLVVDGGVSQPRQGNIRLEHKNETYVISSYNIPYIIPYQEIKDKEKAIDKFLELTGG